MEWQSIQSAPKDQIILLGFAPHWRLEGSRRVFEGRWNEEQNAWTSVNGFLVLNGAAGWMPLPEPPTSLPSSQGGGQNGS